MSKILVAGAGYGGLVASIYLAKAGHRVCIFEMNDEAESGFNRDNRLTFSFIADVLDIDESDLDSDKLIINGSYVFKCLVEKAKAVGVEFYFNTKVNGPVMMNDRIIGLLTSMGNATGDLVIDSAGMFLPVRRTLTLMITDGYATVRSGAFMTTPMNGMVIDLSIKAGKLLADCVINAKTDNYSAEFLWRYNRDYYIRYGDELGRSAGLKNAVLTMEPQGLDFLYENGIIEERDLADGGRNIKLSALLGKFVIGMKKPEYFFALVKGLINGEKISKLYKKPPEKYDLDLIKEWNGKIKSYDIELKK